eukprot:GAHX01001005.1.p1 GENE.GAHX01001005.1~~GAHX01001005.1.p1  ORF type:complete len:542 (-),score=96.08 GAHX01001005.1:32-1657(-)
MPRRKTSKPKQAPKKSKDEEMVMETSDAEILTSPRKTTGTRRKKTEKQKSFSSDSDLELPFNSPISKLGLLNLELSTRTPSKFDTLENVYNRNIMDTPEYDKLRRNRRSIGSLRRQNFDSLDLQSTKRRLAIGEDSSRFSPTNILLKTRTFFTSIFMYILRVMKIIRERIEINRMIIIRMIWYFLFGLALFLCSNLVYKKYAQRMKKPLYTNLEIEETSRDINFDKYLTPYKEAIKNLESLNYDLNDRIDAQSNIISSLQKELKRVGVLENTALTTNKQLEKLGGEVQLTHQTDGRLEKKVESIKDRVLELESEKNQRNKLSTDKDLVRNIKSLHSDMEINKINLHFLNKKVDMVQYGDNTFKYDYALFQHGGRVVGLNSLHFTGNFVLNWLAKGLVLVLNLHRRVKNKLINETSNVKGCTPIKIENAFVMVRLAEDISIKTISYEHLDKSIVVDTSATPKLIHFYGFDKSGTEKYLGEINYERDIKHNENETGLLENIKGYIQSVSVDGKKKYRRLKIKIIENYGNPEYVCLYRIRVHGE